MIDCRAKNHKSQLDLDKNSWHIFDKIGVPGLHNNCEDKSIFSANTQCEGRSNL